ncbi:hypothetical protein TRFO_03890 [Tritrichomonas foetus]|uniref:Myb-like DNA-binding domain containing protein n=1 Tax=Tritrichomonas foetus TaxID=1144522 RepID=A0A1J4KPE8_9EUKA|nr:hypothetical protein TRFO_03890 [Tritrichomonas foetus]|eukprot:OHT11668.1 hypothetical protein TRFO_03890 [Tritrichomonas foetus]
MHEPPDIDPEIDKEKNTLLESIFNHQTQTPLTYPIPESLSPITFNFQNENFEIDHSQEIHHASNYNSPFTANAEYSLPANIDLSQYSYNQSSNSTNNIDNQSKQKTKFTEEEDEIIRKFVEEYGAHTWTRISPLIPNRTPRQVRERWVNYLSPDISRDPWTQEEDDLIMKLVDKFGKRWSYISRSFNKRTDVSIKNRYILLNRRKNSKMRKEMISKLSKKTINQLENKINVQKKKKTTSPDQPSLFTNLTNDNSTNINININHPDNIVSISNNVNFINNNDFVYNSINTTVDVSQLSNFMNVVNEHFEYYEPVADQPSYFQAPVDVSESDCDAYNDELVSFPFFI